MLEALKELITQSNSYIEVITQLPRMDTGLNWLIIVLNFNFEFYVRNVIVQINLSSKKLHLHFFLISEQSINGQPEPPASQEHRYLHHKNLRRPRHDLKGEIHQEAKPRYRRGGYPTNRIFFVGEYPPDFQRTRYLDFASR